MQHPDEGTIHAWLDGELAPNDAQAIDAHVQDCAVCGARVAEARGLIAATSRILTALDDVPAGVLPGRAADGALPGAALAELRARRATGVGRHAQPRWLRPGMLAAAGIAFVAIASVAVLRRGAGTVAETAPSTASMADTPAIATPSVVSKAQVAPPASEPDLRKAAPARESKKEAGGFAAGVGTHRTMDSVSATVATRPVTDTAIVAARAIAERRDVPVQLQSQEQVQAKLRVQRSSAPAPAPVSIPAADSLAGQRPLGIVDRQASARDAAANFAKAAFPATNAELLAGCYEFDRDVARRALLPERIALDGTFAPSVSEGGDSVWFRARALDRDTAFIAVELLWTPRSASTIRDPYDAVIMLRRNGLTSRARVALVAATRAIAPASLSGQVGSAGTASDVVQARRIGCPR